MEGDLVRSLQPPDIFWFTVTTNCKYITPLLTLVRRYMSSPFWCLCQRLSLSLLYFNKTTTQNLWVIKPCLWPQIEFFSSRSQESWHLSWFSNSFSSWRLIWDSSGQGKDAWSSSSLFSYQTSFLLYLTNSTVCLCEWMTRPAWSKWGALLWDFTVTSYSLWQKSCQGIILICQCQESPKLPLRGAARNGQIVWTKLSLLSETF